MQIGVPKEIKNHEYRVGLTPSSVRELVAHGHAVLVETDPRGPAGQDPVCVRLRPAMSDEQDGGHACQRRS